MVRGCMVYTERAEKATVSHGTNYVTTKTTLKVHHLGGYSKCAIKNKHSLIQNHVQ